MSVRTAAVWAMVSQYASFAIQFATSVVLARWFIGPDQLGLFSIAFAAITLVAFLQDFGVNRYITGERELTPEKLATAFTISVVFAGGIALLAMFAAGPIARFYGNPQMLPVAQIIAASYMLVPLAIVPQAVCQRRMDFKSNAMIEICSALANAVVACTLAIKGYGALALGWGAFAQQAARMVVAQWRTGVMLPWPLVLTGTRPIFQLGGTNSVQAVCGSITARAPELVIGRLIDNAAVGLFARAGGLALQLRLLLAGAVTGVFYPAFRQVRDRGDPLGPPYLRVVAAYTGITWPAMAGIALLAAPIIRILYGPRWIAAAPLLAWIALSQICYVALPLNTDLPMLLGRMRQLIRRYIAESITSVLLLALTAPFGLVWVAISRLLHGVLFLGLYSGLMKQMLGFSWKGLLTIYLQSAGATLAALLPTAVFYGVWAGPERAGLAQLSLSAVLGAGCWLISLRLLRHPAYLEVVATAGHLWQALPRLRPAPST
jgi:O-antigen/teichoic acid export membrane protein